MAKHDKAEKPKPKLKRRADPLRFLLDVMNSEEMTAAARVRAAMAAAKIIHAEKRSERVGKKEEREEAAERASRGRFAPQDPPKLAVVGGRKPSGSGS